MSDLRICNSVVDSRSLAVRPPDQQLSSFIEAGICGTGTYTSSSPGIGGGQGATSLCGGCVCVCKIPEAKVTDFLDFCRS
jgi:hypothetical protein